MIKTFIVQHEAAIINLSCIAGVFLMFFVSFLMNDKSDSKIDKGILYLYNRMKRGTKGNEADDLSSSGGDKR